MNEKVEKVKKIIASGLLRSCERLNKISVFKWDIKDVRFEIYNQDYESLCVYLIAKDFDRVCFLLFIDKKEAKDIFRVFSGYFLSDSLDFKKSYEILISELGNIVLNSVLSELANTLNTSIIPDIPRTINGSKMFLLENISLMLEENKTRVPFSSRVIASAGDNMISMEVYFFIDNNLLKKL